MRLRPRFFLTRTLELFLIRGGGKNLHDLDSYRIQNLYIVLRHTTNADSNSRQLVVVANSDNQPLQRLCSISTALAEKNGTSVTALKADLEVGRIKSLTCKVPGSSEAYSDEASDFILE